MSTGTAALKQAVGADKAAVRETSPVDKFKTMLLQRRSDLSMLIGAQNVDRFIQVAINAVIHNPELLHADAHSLILACRQAALDGLYPDNKEAVFNIYNTKVKQDGREIWVRKVQYLPMVRGLIRLLWETGWFTMIDAAAVYEKDYFLYRRGDDPKIEHKPYDGDDDPGEIIAAYFVGKLANGEVKREVMFRRDIEKARAASKTPSSDSSPWARWYDQMAIKSVFHRVWKQLPSTPRLEGVIERDVTTTLGDTMQLAAAPQNLLPEHAGGEAPPTFSPGANEPVETVDRQTGEITQPEQRTQATPGASRRGRREVAAESASAPAPSTGPADLLQNNAGLPFTRIDALARVDAGDFDMAREMAAQLGDEVRREIEEKIESAGG